MVYIVCKAKKNMEPMFFVGWAMPTTSARIALVLSKPCEELAHIVVGGAHPTQNRGYLFSD
jgi:hypothetical protein